MIEVDDSELDEDDREFLTHRAEALEVPIGVLVLRILEAALDGDQYIKGRPREARRLNLVLASPKFQLKIIDDDLDLFEKKQTHALT